MEGKEKVPITSEPNPNGDEQVNAADLEQTENGQGSADKGEENPQNGRSEEGGDTPQAKQKQDRETDAKYAEERRKRKAREEAQRKAREDEIRRQAVFDVKKGQVTADELSELGLAKVEDEDQLFLVEQLRKAKAEGHENPTAKAYQDLYGKHAADKAKAKAQADAEEADKKRMVEVVATDQRNFLAKFGKSTAEVMKNEKEFMDLFGGLIDSEKGNFTELYTAYSTMKTRQSDAAKREGSFPTNSNGAKTSAGEADESPEDFKKRYIATYGRW